MDLQDAWNNYKSLLSIVSYNDPNLVRDYLSKLCTPRENFTNSSKLTQLFAMVVSLRNCDLVSILLQQGVRAKPSDDFFNCTPMQLAVKSGYVSLMFEMLQAGATYDEIDSDGNNLMHLAMINKYKRWKFLDSCACVSKKLVKTETEAEIIEILKILLDLGLNVNAQNNNGESLLSFAVEYKLQNVIVLLLQRNATPMIYGKTITHYLIMEESECWRKREAATNITEHEGPWTVQEKTEFMDWWLSTKIDINLPCNGETPLQLCVRQKMPDVLQTLLQHTDQIHQVDMNGRTLLHILLGSIENSLRIKVKKSCGIQRSAEIIRILVEKGISVDEIDKCGNTPFHIAAKLKTTVIMKALIANFRNVNAYNNVQETVLHLVAKNCVDHYEEDYCEILRALVIKGADMNCQDRCGKTPLHFLCLKNRKISRRLLNYLVEKGCNVCIPDDQGVTPLHVAIRMKCIEMAEKLIVNGADVNCRDHLTRSTPLHDATRNNLAVIVESLLQAGAKPELKDMNGQTSLHVSAMEMIVSPAIMLQLLLSGADVEVLDNDNRAPLAMAFVACDEKKIALLLDFGAKIYGIERTLLMPSRIELDIVSAKNILVKQLLARSLAGLHVRNCYSAVVQRAQREYATFQEQCLQELNAMREFMVVDVSLFAILGMNLKRRYAYASNPVLKAIVTDYGFLNERFPIYRHIITAAYWSAVQRHPLYDPAKTAWNELIKFPLAELCIEEVFAYLGNDDLKLMAEAVPVIP